MRGDDRQQAAMWSYVSAKQRVPQEHPLRPIRKMVDGALPRTPSTLNLPSPQGDGFGRRLKSPKDLAGDAGSLRACITRLGAMLS